MNPNPNPKPYILTLSLILSPNPNPKPHCAHLHCHFSNFIIPYFCSFALSLFITVHKEIVTSTVFHAHTVTLTQNEQ